jgi:hypothetical protein
MVIGAAVDDGLVCCAWASVKAQLRAMKTTVVITAGNLAKADRWSVFIGAQPFFGDVGFIVAQVIPGRGGLRV